MLVHMPMPSTHARLLFTFLLHSSVLMYINSPNLQDYPNSKILMLVARVHYKICLASLVPKIVVWQPYQILVIFPFF